MGQWRAGVEKLMTEIEQSWRGSSRPREYTEGLWRDAERTIRSIATDALEHL